MLNFKQFLAEKVALPYLYHGTSSRSLKSIQKNGLRPASEKFDRGVFGVYLTTEPDIALQEAIATCTGVDVGIEVTPSDHMRSDGQPVVLVLDRTKIKGLESDYDGYPSDTKKGQHSFISKNAVPYSAVVDTIEFKLSRGFKWEPKGLKYQKYRELSHRPATKVEPPKPPETVHINPASPEGLLVNLISRYKLVMYQPRSDQPVLALRWQTLNDERRDVLATFKDIGSTLQWTVHNVKTPEDEDLGAGSGVGSLAQFMKKFPPSDARYSRKHALEVNAERVHDALHKRTSGMVTHKFG